MASDHKKKIQEQLDGLLDGFASFRGSERRLNAAEHSDEAFSTHAESSPLVSVLIERASVMEDSDHASEMICEAAKIHLEGEDGEEASLAVLTDGLEKFPGSLRIVDMIFSWGQRHGRFSDVEALFENIDGLMDVTKSKRNLLKLRMAALYCVSNKTKKSLVTLENINSIEKDDNADSYFDMIEDQSLTEDSVLVCADFFERVNEHDRALRLLNKAVVVSIDSTKKSHLYYKIGVIESILGRTRTAEWNYEQALLLNATCEKSLRQIRKCLRRQGKTHELLRLLTKVHALNSALDKRAELAYEIALLHEELGNEEEAVACFKRVLDDSPEHSFANYALAINLFKEGRFNEAEHYFDIVLRSVPSPQFDSLEIVSKAALCYSKTNSHEKAVVAFEMALESAPQNTTLMVGLAGALLNNQEFEKSYEKARSAFMASPNCPPETGAELLGILGHCQNQGGHFEQAEAFYRRSLEATFNLKIWKSYDCLLDSQGKFFGRVRLLTEFVEWFEEDDLVTSLSDLSGHGISKGERSEPLVAFYLKVLKRFPNNRPLLQAAIDYFSFTQKWSEAVQSILKIAHMETRNYEKAKCFHAACSFERKYGDATIAAEYGTMAIDAYFAVAKEDKSDDSKKTAIDLFYKMNDVFYKLGDFKAIERNYRKILKKFGPQDSIAAELWKEIGCIYRDHLGQRKSAIHAFEVAAGLGLDTVECEKKLLSLYEETGAEHSEKAMQKRLQMLKVEPFESEHYKALRKIYVARHEMDKVWCVTQVLSFLGKADESESAFYEKFRSVERRPQREMNATDWGSLVAESGDRDVGAILGVVCETVALMHGRDPNKLDLESNATLSFEMLRTVFDSLQSSMGCPKFQVLIQPQKEAGLSMLNAKSSETLLPMISCGRLAFEGRHTSSIVFDLARFLTYSKREHYLNSILKGDDELSAVFCAAVSLVYPETKSPRHLLKKIRSCKKVLETHLTLPLRQELTRAVVEFNSKGGNTSMKNWRANVDTCALRAGLLLSGDLKSASDFLAVKNKNKIRSDQAKELGELLVFCVSEEHFSLREKLGLAIDSFEPKELSRTLSN